ncbi:MAG: hypothetical protein WD577_01715 [Bacteroidales bacterium]
MAGRISRETSQRREDIPSLAADEDSAGGMIVFASEDAARDRWLFSFRQKLSPTAEAFGEGISGGASLEMRSLLIVNDEFWLRRARRLGSDGHNVENGVFLQPIFK